MMQRSDLLAVALGLAATVAVYLALGELAGLVVGAGLAVGIAAALLLAPRPSSRGRVRKVPRRALQGARARPAAASVVSLVPAARTLRTAPRFEAGAAAVPELRLTRDILTGMHTGGKTTRGKCSSCGATLWLSARRPVKARCPNCGHTRVLER